MPVHSLHHAAQRSVLMLNGKYVHPDCRVQLKLIKHRFFNERTGAKWKLRRPKSVRDGEQYHKERARMITFKL